MHKPPRLDVYSVRLFLAAAEAGSIARAAEQEHIAASALSRRLSDLEHAFGIPLLVRSARGIELTDAGKRLYDHGQRMEAGLRDLLNDIWSTSEAITGSVRLFANASAIVGYLPERLRSFSLAHPQARISLQEQRSGDVLRACAEDRADLGVAVATSEAKGLESWHFAFDPLIVVMPAHHPLSTQASIGLALVLQAGLVGLQPGGALDQLVSEHANAHKLDVDLPVTVNSFDAACRMVEAGLGVSIVPTSAAAAYAGSDRFERRELAESWAARELRLYAPRKSSRPRAVDALIASLTASTPNPGDPPQG